MTPTKPSEADEIVKMFVEALDRHLDDLGPEYIDDYFVCEECGISQYKHWGELVDRARQYTRPTPIQKER
jgi:hypothetical protein